MRERQSPRLRYKEGPCPEFGKVRPIHLHELTSVERRLEVSQRRVVAAVRLGWRGYSSVPKPAEYVSLHTRQGKTLMVVDRVAPHCFCCYTAPIFVYALEVEGVLPQGKICDCALDTEWVDSAVWNAPPGEGSCRKAGSKGLLAISEAIKRKASGK